MKTGVLKRVLLRIVSDCAVDLKAAVSAFVQAGQAGLTVVDCLDWLFYDIAEASRFPVPE